MRDADGVWSVCFLQIPCSGGGSSYKNVPHYSFGLTLVLIPLVDFKFDSSIGSQRI
jgi:hypothetical protein